MGQRMMLLLVMGVFVVYGRPTPWTCVPCPPDAPGTVCTVSRAQARRLLFTNPSAW